MEPAKLRPRYLALFVGLDDVAFLQVLEVAEPDAALEPGLDLTYIVLEAPERVDRALPDDGAVTEEADLRPAGDDAVRDVTAGDGADAGDAEDVSDFGIARDDLFDLGRQHPDH